VHEFILSPLSGRRTAGPSASLGMTKERLRLQYRLASGLSR
jgi:hypothetical protein